MKRFLTLIALVTFQVSFAQKKPLDHSSYKGNLISFARGNIARDREL